jgi:RimJ/RimL family protein N-acetyltransferase
MNLIGERIFLREVKVDDFEFIAKWKNDPLIRKMSVGSDTTITQENQLMDIKRSIENNQPYNIICLKENNQPIGYIRINWMDDHHRFAWLRFGLGEKRGQGYAREALVLYTNYLFELGVHRIDAEVFKFNEKSFNLLKRIGFIHEGTKKDAHFDNNEYFDVYVLGKVNII